VATGTPNPHRPPGSANLAELHNQIALPLTEAG
jgi:hypothetical protein